MALLIPAWPPRGAPGALKGAIDDGAPPHLHPPPPSPSSFLEGSPSSRATDDNEDDDDEDVRGINDFALPVGDPLNNAKRILHGVQSLTRICSLVDNAYIYPLLFRPNRQINEIQR